MAFLQVDFFSNVLGKSMSMNVLLPQTTAGQIGMEGKGAESYPVLYLLHGRSDDHTTWMRRTCIERYAAEKGLAVVMPNGDLSFYTNMAHGGDYFTYISEEIPALCHDFFPRISQKREQTFVAGLSMGGYGAFKLALRLPERFCFAAALSGVLDICAFVQRDGRASIFNHIFENMQTLRGSEEDLLAVAGRLAESGKPRPKLYAWCGTEDPLVYQDHPGACAELKRLGYDITYEESPGDHSWGYWDEQIKRVIHRLPL